MEAKITTLELEIVESKNQKKVFINDGEKFILYASILYYGEGKPKPLGYVLADGDKQSPGYHVVTTVDSIEEGKFSTYDYALQNLLFQSFVYQRSRS